MKRAKRLAALALALALALSLAGCGAMEDVSRTLVQGNLDEIYLGKYSDEFLELVDITADEAEANYLQGLQTEAEFFTYYFDITYPTEELTNELVELYKEIYSHSRYEVGESTKVDDTTYGVQLTIYPIDIMQKVVDQSEPVITSSTTRPLTPTRPTTPPGRRPSSSSAATTWTAWATSTPSRWSCRSSATTTTSGRYTRTTSRT